MTRAHSRILVIALVGVWLASSASAAELDSLRQKQAGQEKARVLTRELVSGILDIQIRQLEENGLRDLPIYGEIRQMRENINELVDAEMREVVELLVKAQEGTQDERLANFTKARESVRQIVLTLMAERQKLLKRLQIARLSAQVRQLIQMETATLGTTRGLDELPAIERERFTLLTIQDQRDVKALFLVLVETLADVSTWGGPTGAGAADGLRILKTAQVGQELDHADQHLEGANYADAATSQMAVIRGLRLLLDKLEETQGLISSDREAALKMVREMIERQEKLKSETKETPSEDTKLEELVDQQSQLHADLGKMAEALAAFPSTTPLLEQAKAAAYEATSQLFDRQTQPATAEQSKVIGNLAQIEAELQSAIDADSNDKSAEELAGEVAQLEKVKDQLQQAAAQQAEATKNAARNPDAARQQEANVAKTLDEAAKSDAPLPPAIESRVADAQEAVEQAAEKLSDVANDQAESREQAAVSADEAIQRALAETEARLADTKRKQKAVEVGELARAAEALERAASAEREIAADAEQAAMSEGLDADTAKELAMDQADVAAVAEKIAEGVKAAAPDVSQQLADASKPIAEAQQQLEAAKANPGESSKAAAKQASEAAKSAAKQLEKSAAGLRAKAGEAAKQLAEIANQQLEQVAAVRAPVEQALANAEANFDDPIANLEQALNKVKEAQQDQLWAEGRSAAADAMKQAEQTAGVANKQSAANEAANELAQGRANTPLEAATAQQDVADAAAAAAKEAGESPVGKALKQAAKAAAEAAKQTLAGNAKQAEAARQAANEAVAAAKNAAESAAAEAMQQPAGKPSAAAQKAVAQKASEAGEQAATGSPDAAQSLGVAQKQATAAAEAIDNGAAETAKPAQEAAGNALGQAAEQLQAAIENASGESMKSLAQQATEAKMLAGEAAKIDADAAAALQQAQQAAARTAMPAAARSQPEAMATPAQIAEAQQQAQRGLQRAAASLAARQQQIQRDRQIAEALTQLATEQQLARDEIAQQSAALAEMSAQQSAAATPPADGQPAVAPPTGTPSPEQVSAAQMLQQATQRFAEAQRATGQGAAAVSGQQQVANQPIREALETASNLGPIDLPAAMSPLGTESMLADASTGLTSAAEPVPGEPAIPGNAQPAEPVPGEPAIPGNAQPAGEGQPTGDVPEGISANGQPAEGQPGTPTGQSAQPGQPGTPGQFQPPTPNALGTGLIPNAPQLTAEQIAGVQAMSQAAQAIAQSAAAQVQAANQPGQSGQPVPPGTPGQPANPIPGEAASLANVGGVSNSGDSPANQPTHEGTLELQAAADGDSRTADNAEDAAIAARRFDREPWFAKLPPSLRDAILSNARRQAPRGYEQRLRRYFESID